VLRRRRAGAHDTKVKLCNARDEDVEAIPGFIDITAFDANEVEGSNYSGADNTAWSLARIKAIACQLTGIRLQR
jgi:hypothetical protein